MPDHIAHVVRDEKCFAGIQAFHVSVLVLMAAYNVARRLAGRLDAASRVTFDNTRLLWHYAVAEGLADLVLLHGITGLGR